MVLPMRTIMTNINGPHLTNRHSFIKFVTVRSSTVAVCTRELVFYDFFSEWDYKIEAYYILRDHDFYWSSHVATYVVHAGLTFQNRSPLKSVYSWTDFCRNFCQNWSPPDHLCCQNWSGRTNFGSQNWSSFTNCGLPVIFRNQPVAI